jgi:hypothetical protein
LLGVAILRRADVINADFYGVESASIMELANIPKASYALYPSHKQDLR